MRHLVTLKLGLSILLLALATIAGAPSARADLSADQIVEKMLKQGLFGLDEAESTVRMSNKKSKEDKPDVRVMENVRRRKNGLLQSIVRFRSPASIAGTAFLMLERKEGESEQWLKLPRYPNARRIPGREREGSFMGSQFSYADMERRDVRYAEHRRLPDEEWNKVKLYVLESIPKKDSGSPYSKIETWVQQDNFLPRRIRFYDKSGSLLKTLYSGGTKEIKGQTVIIETTMVNKQTGEETTLIVDDIRERKDIPDTEFTPTALEHG